VREGRKAKREWKGEGRGWDGKRERGRDLAPPRKKFLALPLHQGWEVEIHKPL